MSSSSIPAPADPLAAAAPAAMVPEATDVEKKELAANARYSFEEEKLQALRSESPWQQDPKYFKSVALSPSAIMKMMMHCQSGVNKGIKKGGNPIEVMGLLLGRPDPDAPHTLVVCDAFPLPIEGFETRVIADDANVVNHMISLGECLEATRKEKFMGWYHSHPFDLSENSHAFLSQTDLSTQLQWQRAEDPYGNPFVAIVVDPLRSLHKSVPELKAFRAYPPEYNSPVPNETPNGEVELLEQNRLEMWGSCWNRYYELEIEYFMSSHARNVLEQLTQDYLWMRSLVTDGKNDNNDVVARNNKLAETVRKATAKMNSGGGGGSSFASFAASTSTSTTAGESSSKQDFEKAVDLVVGMASTQLHETTLEQAKKQIFGKELE